MEVDQLRSTELLEAKIIVATPYANDLRRVQQILEKAENLKIVAHAPGLMELFDKVEHNPPNLVMVSADLYKNADFELIVTLFNALDVRWMMFERLCATGGKPQAPSSGGIGGLFSISLDDNPHVVITQLRAVMQARQSAQQPKQPVAPSKRKRYRRLVLLGSSTGGVDALKTVLADFEADCPPTVIVQHTGQGFGHGLAAVLGRSCGARVRMFEPNQAIESGTVYVVAGHEHHAVLSVNGKAYLGQSHDPPMSGHKPSIDKLFLSAAPYASRIVAAILTGMGRDGADGLLALRNAGARTMNQDEQTSVVYGMPAAAWSNGASMKQVALKDIGLSLLAEAER